MKGQIFSFFDVKFFWFWPRNVMNASDRMHASVLRCKNSLLAAASIRCHLWLQFCAESFGLSFDVFVDTSFVEKFCVLGHRLDSHFPELLQFQCIWQSNKIYNSKESSNLYVLILEMTNCCWKSFECLKWEISGFLAWSQESFDWEHNVDPIQFSIKRSTLRCIQIRWKGLTWWKTSPQDFGWNTDFGIAKDSIKTFNSKSKYRFYLIEWFQVWTPLVI